MMKNTKFLFVALAGLMISSCAEENTETAKVEEEKAETCVYSYSADQSEFEFTAYKFLGKTGVGGTFTEINVKGGEENESDKALIENLEFEIPISSIDTKNEGRDDKIEESFFGVLDVSTISGKVERLDESTKSAYITIAFNGVSNEVRGNYTLEDGEFTYMSEINVNDWQANKGIVSLNEVCHDLHIDHANGDTESKLWPDVSLSFKTKLKKKCD